MKRNKLLTLKAILSLALILLIAVGCKFEASDDSSKVRIDISELKKKLVANSSSSSGALNGPLMAVTSPNSAAQTSVSTLVITPLTFSNRGKPYDPDEPFTSNVEDDLEKDAANSVNFIQLIQLPTSEDFVEVEVPNISEGWQLLAAAASIKLDSKDDLADEDKLNSLAYVGFTKQSFDSADDFNNANVTLEMKRACNQDVAPKGCATYDGDKKAILTAAVEIRRIEINGVTQAKPGGAPDFPWIVRDTTTDAQQLVTATARGYMQDVIDATGDIDTVKVITSHQLSVGQSTECTNLNSSSTDASFDALCGTQEYSYTY